MNFKFRLYEFQESDKSCYFMNSLKYIGIDGREDMKLICGIIVVEEKGSQEKDVKVNELIYLFKVFFARKQLVGF